ncbi:hypothetical protein BJY04DRAFT_179070 [Aspergillus karnatakaensis]|uniref:uncharacterized protein n=1 Tax=Aspergillus karnatakaensis TaxID=1810916 RepID=UPI003CCD8980
MIGQQTLMSAIDKGGLLDLPQDELLRLIGREYTHELDRLKTAYAVAAPKRAPSSSPSPSMTLYGVEYAEINRTLVAVLALRSVLKADYDSLVCSQSAESRLSHQSFQWIVNMFRTTVRTPNDMYLLITSIITNDLGKSPSLAADYCRITNRDITGLNHDAILYRAAREHVYLIPCLHRLPKESQDELILSMELGAVLNFGQMAQAENVPACLSALRALHGNHRSLDLRFLEQLLDLAGAAGHVDHTCALKLTEPIFQSYESVYRALSGVLVGDLNHRQAYDQHLTTRCDMIVQAGWAKGKQLSVHHPEDRALMRLLCICNTGDGPVADLVYEVFFHFIPAATHQALIIALNIDGSVDQPAVQATYIPALCSTAMRNICNGSADDKKQALAAAFRFLARVLTEGVPQSQKALGSGVMVIERDVRGTPLDCVESDGFNHDPSLLDSVGIPGSAVLVVAAD